MGVRSLGPEDPLEEGMTTHSSIPAQRIPRTEEPGGATFHRVAKNRTRLKRLSTRQARSARMPSSALASGSLLTGHQVAAFARVTRKLALAATPPPEVENLLFPTLLPLFPEPYAGSLPDLVLSVPFCDSQTSSRSPLLSPPSEVSSILTSLLTHSGPRIPSTQQLAPKEDWSLTSRVTSAQEKHLLRSQTRPERPGGAAARRSPTPT